MRRLRTAVFVDEQGVPAELEWDGRDACCLHVVAESGEGELIGTGRLLPSGQIGRMAVAREWRRRGVGAALVRTLIALAREHGIDSCFLHAQTTAIPFYERQGFRLAGVAFREAGIVHRKMVTDADPPK